MPSERFVEALNEQVGREFAAAHQYVAIGAYYESETFPQLARFFYGQAEEERGHAMRMVNYLLERGAPMRLGEVPAPRAHFDDHVAPIRLALEQERRVTVEIGGLFEVARETRDSASEIFMQWFVSEQVEEEAAIGVPSRRRRACAGAADDARGIHRARRGPARTRPRPELRMRARSR